MLLPPTSATVSILKFLLLRRMHTRVGSTSENVLARSLAPRQPQQIKGSTEDVPALRRSKVRGRQMVFSLLEAARIEEEDMVRTEEDHGVD